MDIRTPLAIKIFLLFALTVAGCNGEEGTLFRPYPDTAYCQVETGILRTDPVIVSSQIDFLTFGDKVEIVRRGENKVRVGDLNDFWYLVRLENGVEGWIYGASLSFDRSQVRRSVRLNEDEALDKSVGEWWEYLSDNSIGYRRFFLWEDGRFRYGRGSHKVTEGTFTIDLENQRIDLSPTTPAGSSLDFDIFGPELRFRSENDGSVYRFRRASRDPGPFDEDSFQTPGLEIEGEGLDPETGQPLGVEEAAPHIEAADAE